MTVCKALGCGRGHRILVLNDRIPLPAALSLLCLPRCANNTVTNAQFGRLPNMHNASHACKVMTIGMRVCLPSSLLTPCLKANNPFDSWREELKNGLKIHLGTAYRDGFGATHTGSTCSVEHRQYDELFAAAILGNSFKLQVTFKSRYGWVF